MTAPAAAGSAEAATCQRLRGHLAYLGLAAAAEALPPSVSGSGETPGATVTGGT